MIIGVDFVDLDFFLFFFIMFVKMRNSKNQTPVPRVGRRQPVWVVIRKKLNYERKKHFSKFSVSSE